MNEITAFHLTIKAQKANLFKLKHQHCFSQYKHFSVTHPDFSSA